MRSLSLLIASLALLLCSCQRASDVWEGTKTATRYLERKGKSLFSKDVDSQLVKSQEEFYGPSQDDFIPMNEKDLRLSPSTAKEELASGEDNFSIHRFREPTGELSSLFRNIYFNTDDHVVAKKEYIRTVHQVADYLRKHPMCYIYIEGHCDARAAQSYNLPLGSRRAQFVKNLLVKEGVNPKQIFTISYGKERLLMQGSSAEVHAKNRRVQFKIFEPSNHR